LTKRFLSMRCARHVLPGGPACNANSRKPATTSTVGTTLATAVTMSSPVTTRLPRLLESRSPIMFASGPWGPLPHRCSTSSGWIGHRSTACSVARSLAHLTKPRSTMTRHARCVIAAVDQWLAYASPQRVLSRGQSLVTTHDLPRPASSAQREDRQGKPARIVGVDDAARCQQPRPHLRRRHPLIDG